MQMRVFHAVRVKFCPEIAAEIVQIPAADVRMDGHATKRTNPYRPGAAGGAHPLYEDYYRI
jgi:hypothetical protein